MTCKIENLVREAVASLDEGATVQQGAELMAQRNQGSLVVTREGRVVGLFTENDLLKRVVGAGRDPQSLRLADVSSRNLISVSHDSSCRDALGKMQANLCRRLLVFRGAQFVGLIDLTDLAHAMGKKPTKGDLLVNAVGAVTLVVAVGVIAMLVYQLPAMLELVGRVTGR